MSTLLSLIRVLEDMDYITESPSPLDDITFTPNTRLPVTVIRPGNYV